MSISKKPKSSSIIKEQYNLILVALQGLYTDVHNTSDRQRVLEEELLAIKTILLEILKLHQSLNTLEQKVFRDNLKH